jgi:WD repeat-containing protein 23
MPLLPQAWDLRALRRPTSVFVGHVEGVAHLDSKGDGRYFISNGKDQAVKLWDMRAARSSEEAARLPREGVPSFHWDYR